MAFKKWFIAAGLLAAVVLAVALPLLRTTGDPAGRVARLWGRQGIEKPNVILISLDTTRADRLGCYGYANARTPAIDDLARRGVLFSQAASPAPLTLPAHSSMMTGFYPTYHGVRLNGTTALSQQHVTLAEALSSSGYRTGAFVGAFVLDGRWGLNQGFNEYDDRFDVKKARHLDLAGTQRPANEVVDAALRWLDAEKDSQKDVQKDAQKDAPFFAWIHLYDPHTPYAPPEPLFSEFGQRGPAGLYDGEIAFVDRQVARVVTWLQQNALDQRTIIVIAGDHGEALGSHGEGTHGFFIYDWAMHVPFIVSTPFDDLQGVRVDSQVSLVDIFPTVLALTGIDTRIEAKAKGHGRSLLPVMFKPGMFQPGASEADAAYAYGESMAPDLQFGWSALHALRSPRYKFIDAPRPELYDLIADPGEATNIAAREPKLAATMGQELDRLMEETSRGAPALEEADLDQETLERLASLGYVATSASSRRAAGSGPLADPKDKLDVFIAVQRAGELMSRDEHAQAAQALESALLEEPEMPQALLMLGSCYTALGRTAEAKAQFDRVLKHDPRSVPGLIGMANILLEAGQTDDVVTLCKRTLSVDPRNSQAYALLGEVYIDRKQPELALPHLEKAVEIQPKITQNRVNLAASLIEVKQFPRAQQMLDDVLREQPRFPGAWFNQGVLYDEQSRPDEARRAYLAEVANYPNSFEARFNLGKVLGILGDWTGSIAQMREVIRIAPKRAEGYLFLARGLLHERSALDEVQGLVEKGLTLATTPDTKALGWFLMADVFERRQQPDKVAFALKNAAAARASLETASPRN
jgi:arylsulfatase A-like enzyme/Tfp pilus assembly protein PilF